MAYTAENFTRDEIEYLIEKLLDTDLNNQDTASLILDFVEFYCKKRIATAKKLLNHFPDKEYIRFGEIPKDEKSKIGNGCIGDGYKVVGYEKGVSVWDCVYNFDTDLYQLVAPHPTMFTSGDFSQSYDPDNCCGCNPNKKIYVVTGIEVGYGADNEPLLKDVKIIKELPFDYFKQKVISDKKLNKE